MKFVISQFYENKNLLKPILISPAQTSMWLRGNLVNSSIKRLCLRLSVSACGCCAQCRYTIGLFQSFISSKIVSSWMNFFRVWCFFILQTKIKKQVKSITFIVIKISLASMQIMWLKFSTEKKQKETNQRHTFCAINKFVVYTEWMAVKIWANFENNSLKLQKWRVSTNYFHRLIKFEAITKVSTPGLHISMRLCVILYLVSVK